MNNDCCTPLCVTKQMDLSLFVRLVLISICAMIAMIFFTFRLPSSWRLAIDDLRLQQLLTFAILAWALLASSLALCAKKVRRRSIVDFGMSLVDLAVVTTVLIGLVQGDGVGMAQSNLLSIGLVFVVTITAFRRSVWLVYLTTIVAIALYLSLPQFQASLGIVGRAAPSIQQLGIVVFALANGFMIARLAKNQSAQHQSTNVWLAETAAILSLSLPCILVCFVEPWAGVAVAIPTLFTLRAIRSGGETIRRLAILVSSLAGIAALLFSLYTSAGGFLFADSLLTRIFSELTRRYPAVGANWTGYATVFSLLFLLVDQAIRLVFDKKKDRAEI